VRWFAQWAESRQAIHLHTRSGDIPAHWPSPASCR
jgi:hypothetical protein